MRRIAVWGIALTAVVAVPAAQAAPKPHPAKSHKCKPHAVGFSAWGTLVSHTLTQSAGADTADRGDDRYSGTVVVTVTKANHRAPKGEQTFTVANARVRFSDANGDGAADAPAAGDRVKIQGKITRLAKKCDATGFKATTTVKKVDFKPAKPVEDTPTS